MDSVVQRVVRTYPQVAVLDDQPIEAGSVCEECSGKRLLQYLPQRLSHQGPLLLPWIYRILAGKSADL